MERVVESVGHLKIKEKISPVVKSGRDEARNVNLTRKPCLNTVNEQDGSDLESLVSTFVKNSKLSKSSNQRVQSLENPEMNVGCISCNFCGTAYDDAKGLRRHIKAKHR